MTTQRIFAFDEATLHQALEAWKAKQLAGYPHQRERIEVTALAMRDFFADEEVVRGFKLVAGTSSGPTPAAVEEWDDPLGGYVRDRE